MSMPDAGRRSSVYVGTGSVREFSFAFKIFAEEQVAVYRLRDGAEQEELVPTTEYSVSLEEIGGTVAFTTAPAQGDKIVIVSAIEYTQGLGLNNFGAFNPSDLTDAWDKNTALIQQVLDLAKRSVQLPQISDETPDEFTDALFAARDEAVDAQHAAESAANSAGRAASAAYQYATNAQTSAGAAAQSENNAKGSADAAATSEKNAASSASAAAGSESAAKTSETNAKASETAAKNAQTAAESSKSAAASSASQAAQSATNAANSAASLSEAVQQASSSASAAAQSASAAQQSAQRAEEIADSLGNPLSKEEAAKTYATKTALTQGLGTKAPSNHSHTSDQITDLDQKFAEKLSPYATTETVNSGLSGKANAAHTHTMAQISDLSFDFGKWEAA